MRESDKPERRFSRRRLLAATGSAAATGMAGCAGLGGDGNSTDGGGNDNGDGTPTPTPTPTPATPAPSPAVSPGDCEPEVVSSDITSDTTWSADDCSRIALGGNIQVQNGATLTVEAGVEVVAKKNTKLTVKGNGTLVADGGPDPVVFYGESRDRGYWRGIEIESKNGNEFTRTLVRDGGRGGWSNVWVRGDAGLSVASSTFATSETWGLVFENGATVPEFTNNTFAGNRAALRAATDVVGALDGASTYAGGNDDDRIEVPRADVETDATWAATDAPYYFEGNPALKATITVAPGGEFTFAKNAKMTVKSGGALTVGAADGKKTVFRGAKKTAGYWRGIEIETDNADNDFANTTVRDGGRGGWSNVWVRGDAGLSVTDSTFANSETWGLVFENGATVPEFAANAFTNNRAALRAATDVVGALDGESTYAGGNDDDRIEVPRADVETDATWAATDAPYYFEGNPALKATITVAPGGEFTFAKNAKMTVKSGGAFTADAGDGDDIIFRGAQRSPGHWRGFELESDSPDNVFNNVVVAHGGRGGWANIWVRSKAQGTVTNSTIRGSTTWGIVVEEGATFEGSNNTYDDNVEGGIRNENN